MIGGAGWKNEKAGGLGRDGGARGGAYSWFEWYVNRFLDRVGDVFARETSHYVRVLDPCLKKFDSEMFETRVSISWKFSQIFVWKS